MKHSKMHHVIGIYVNSIRITFLISVGLCIRFFAPPPPFLTLILLSVMKPEVTRIEIISRDLIIFAKSPHVTLFSE